MGPSGLLMDHCSVLLGPSGLLMRPSGLLMGHCAVLLGLSGLLLGPN